MQKMVIIGVSGNLGSCLMKDFSDPAKVIDTYYLDETTFFQLKSIEDPCYH